MYETECTYFLWLCYKSYNLVLNSLNVTYFLVQDFCIEQISNSIDGILTVNTEEILLN